MQNFKHLFPSLFVLLFILMSCCISIAQNDNQGTNSSDDVFIQANDIPVFSIQALGDFENVRINSSQIVDANENEQDINDGMNNGPTDTSGTNNSFATNCPMMYVDVDITSVESCLSSDALISFCNHGTADAFNAFVDIQMDTALHLDSASLSFSIIGTDRYRFQIGTLTANNCGSFQLFFTTVCDSSLLSEEHCIQANIKPDTLCDAVWDTRLIAVDAVCNGHDIVFSVFNKGVFIPLSGQVTYIIIEDHLLVQNSAVILQQGVLTLGSNKSTSFTVNSNTALRYKLEVRDSAGAIIAFSSVHNCSPANISSSSVFNYHAQQFWNGSHIPSQDVFCEINGNSSPDGNSSSSENINQNIVDNDNENNQGNYYSSFSADSEPTQVFIYPNPFDNFSNVRIDGPIAENFSFRLYNITGSEVQVIHLTDQREFRIERDNLLKGMYFYRIEARGELVSSGKIMIK